MKIFGVICAALFTLFILGLISLLIYGRLAVFKFSFNYVPKEKTIQTQFESLRLNGAPVIKLVIPGDVINSEIKDNLPQISSSLPKGMKIMDIYFDTNSQRVYINSDYGIVRLPISCKIDIEGKGSKILYTLKDFKFGSKNLPIPQFLITSIFDGNLRQQFDLEFKYSNVYITNIAFENSNAIVTISLR